jgi:hypothetical protein
MLGSSLFSLSYSPDPDVLSLSPSSVTSSFSSQSSEMPFLSLPLSFSPSPSISLSPFYLLISPTSSPVFLQFVFHSVKQFYLPLFPSLSCLQNKFTPQSLSILSLSPLPLSFTIFSTFPCSFPFFHFCFYSRSTGG